MRRHKAIASPSGRSPLIREASEKDIVQLKQLEDGVFDYDRLSQRSIARAIQSKTQIVLALESLPGVIEGAAFLHFRSGSKCCRLYSIAIKNETAGGGLGTLLLKHCEEAARLRGCREMRLEVRADKDRLIRFYLRNGYRREKLISRYYDNGADALSMLKAL